MNSSISGIADGSGASIKAVISINGHGSNTVEELGGNYVVVNSRLEFGETSGGSDFITDNDFRQIGLIKNPVNNVTSNILTDGTASVQDRSH